MKTQLTQKDKNTILIINRFLNRIKNVPNQSIASFKEENKELDFHPFVLDRICKVEVVTSISNNKKRPYYISDYDVLNVDEYLKVKKKIYINNRKYEKNKGIKNVTNENYARVMQEVFSKMGSEFTSKEFTKECRKLSDSAYFSRLVGKGEIIPLFLKDKTRKISKFTYQKIESEKPKVVTEKPTESKKKQVTEPLEYDVKSYESKEISILWGLFKMKIKNK